MRALKIKKVDDKPMVTHTKEKAKIHFEVRGLNTIIEIERLHGVK